MSQKRSLTGCFLFAAVLLLLAGCGSTEDGESGLYTVYFKDASGTSLHEVSYSTPASSFTELVDELMGEIREAPSDTNYQSVLPTGVEIQGYERGIDSLQIDFSNSYYDMDNIEEILLRAAVVKTFTQIPGVNKIMITVAGKQLVDADGEPVPSMDGDSFIDTKENGISSYRYTTVELYFPAGDGTKLKKEVRNVDYSSNMVPERVIVEQLIAGSSDPSLLTAVNPSAGILDISTRGSVCTINFSEEFNHIPTDKVPSAEAALYSIVNSICSTQKDIEEVKFTVEGSDDVMFWNEIDLDTAFSLNEDLIEPETETEKDEEEAADEEEKGEENPEPEKDDNPEPDEDQK